MKKIWLISVIIFSVTIVLFAGCNQQSVGEELKPSYERITIIGETSNKGVFDPSVEYNQDGSVGWLVYSGLEQPRDDIRSPYPKYIHTHLAKTTDHGKTWIFIKRLTESSDDNITIVGKKIKGVWHHEVPTLVYDPDDIGKEWKLFWHKYFSMDNPKSKSKPRPRIYKYSWIMYKEANSPQELDSAKELKLFDSNMTLIKAKYNLNKLLNWDEPIAFSEPGSLYKDGVLYFSLNAFTGDSIESKLFLLVSFNHGSTWQYVGNLIDYDDAADLGYVRLTASSLVQEKGRVFILVSPIILKGDRDGAHLGTLIFEFEDISKGKLKRDEDGKLIAHKYLPPSVSLKYGNAGESDYDEYNTYGGIIMPQADPNSAPAIGQIFNTKERILE